MAIYSLHHGHVGKATQKQAGTAGAHVHYITRDGAARLVMGEHMPTDRHQARAWMDEREAADRKNGRVIDKLMVALPLELDGQQRADLVAEFVAEIGGGRVSWLAAIHDRGKDAQNPHCHLILRDKDHDTGKRVFGTSEKGSTDRLREIWETVANRALEREGIEARIDRRSLADQAIAREPGIHVGPNVQAMEERGLRPVSIAQDHTTSRGTERVIDWPTIDDGRTRADRQREIEAMNRQAEAERGKDKGRQEAEHTPPAANSPEPAREGAGEIAPQAQEIEAPEAEAEQAARVVAAEPQAIQRASQEPARQPEQIELRLERHRLVEFVTAARDRLAGLAQRLEHAFQAVWQRHQAPEPQPDPGRIQPPEKQRQDPEREEPAAAERDPWAALVEIGRKEREGQPQPEPERDNGRSLWDDWSQGRQRKPPGPSW